MDTPEHERYVFLRFASASIDEAIRILDEDGDELPLWTRYAALRYAVICYFRPFTAGITHFAFPQPDGASKKRLALRLSTVPSELLETHRELSEYRHSAYAHTDIAKLTPQLRYWPNSSIEFPISFEPVDRKPLHLQKRRMADLFQAVRANVVTQIAEAESDIRIQATTDPLD